MGKKKCLTKNSYFKKKIPAHYTVLKLIIYCSCKTENKTIFLEETIFSLS